VYTDPNGESFTAFAIGFVVGAYLTGSLYNKDFTPWSTGKNGDESWAWDDPGMYITMGIGGLAGGFGAAMGWGVIAEGYSFNMTLGTGIGEAVQAGAQFTASASGISFQGLGYATAAGGGGFLTYEAIKGINNIDPAVKEPYYKNGILYTNEADALQSLYYLSQGDEPTELIMYALHDGGYWYEPFRGYYGGEYKSNSNSNCYPYTHLYTNPMGTTYVSPSFNRSYSINYMAHPHPGSNPPSGADASFARNRNLNVFTLGYDRNIHVAERNTGYRVETGITFWDILLGRRSLRDYYSRLF